MTGAGADVREAPRKIALVVAMARNRVIGLNGGMPWHMPSDLKTFRRLTMGRPIVMGRKTFQSIGRALDGRTNIVVTRDPTFEAEAVVVAGSFEQALQVAQKAPSADDSVMIIGGGEIYLSALLLADTIYLTEIASEPVGDVWFPELDQSIWREASRTAIEADPRDAHSAELVVYDRVRPEAGD